ncbi:DNA repair protein RecO [Rubritalea tangerina]|uniref:DNA repair protein RecO n=1 Tax=Rubritalea tangerina TaxID=430798 RepID=A0ABW4Z7K6_9BACT
MQSGRGIILRLTKLSDTSLIVTWCVEGHGLVKTVAKGARNAKGKFSGKIDLFYLAEIDWVESRRSELHTLREVQPLEYHAGLRQRYKDVLMAGYFSALVEHVMEVGLSEEEVFDLLQRALQYLDQKGGERRGLEHFENELAKMTGVWDGKRRSFLALEDAFGKLPPTRKQCLELLDA